MRCLPYMLRSPSGEFLKPDVIMFNWGLHDGPLFNKTQPGQYGAASWTWPSAALRFVPADSCYIAPHAVLGGCYVDMCVALLC